jgi:hypothetical protein
MFIKKLSLIIKITGPKRFSITKPHQPVRLNTAKTKTGLSALRPLYNGLIRQYLKNYYPLVNFRINHTKVL